MIKSTWSDGHNKTGEGQLEKSCQKEESDSGGRSGQEKAVFGDRKQIRDSLIDTLKGQGEIIGSFDWQVDGVGPIGRQVAD